MLVVQSVAAALPPCWLGVRQVHKVLWRVLCPGSNWFPGNNSLHGQLEPHNLGEPLAPLWVARSTHTHECVMPAIVTVNVKKLTMVHDVTAAAAKSTSASYTTNSGGVCRMHIERRGSCARLPDSYCSSCCLGGSCEQQQGQMMCVLGVGWGTWHYCWRLCSPRLVTCMLQC